MVRRSWSAYDKRLAGARQGWRCGHCRELLDAAFEVDHVLALADGGSDDLDSNAEALCRRCHGAKTLRESAARLARAPRPVVLAARRAPSRPLHRLPPAHCALPATPPPATPPPPAIPPPPDANPFAHFAYVPESR